MLGITVMQVGNHWRQRLCSTRLLGLLAGFALTATTCFGQGYQPAMNLPPAYSGGPAMQAGYPADAMMFPNGSPNAIEYTAYATKKKPNKPLPYSIVSMPQAEEELEVIHHRSQLVVTRNRITRWAISDPSVMDILQYSPNEISIIGLALGTTHLTLWFEGEKDPLIYRAEVIRDPNLDDRRKEDYAKLERELKALFPNSQVFLVPLTWRLIVKGQARDQEFTRNDRF